MFVLLGLCVATATAAPTPPDLAEARLSPVLRVARDLGPLAQADWLDRQRGRLGEAQIKIHVELHRDMDGEAFLARHPRIEREMDLQVRLGSSLQIGLRLDQLQWLSSLDEIRRIRLPQFAKPKTYTTEGLDTLFVGDSWHQKGITGEGVRIAVIDIGFQGYAELIGSELPVGLDDSALKDGWEADDHGTAVAEIIHDVAPAAEIQLFNFETELEFRSLLMDFVDGVYEADVINASIGFDNVWNADGTSPYAVGVDAVFDSGIVYVAASGNEAESYRWGPLTDVDNNGFLEVGGVEGVWVSSSSAYGGNWAEVSLRWSDPMMGSRNDLDLWITEEDDSVECGRSENPQEGEDNPFEYVSCELQGDWGVAWIVAHEGAKFEGKRAWVYSYAGVDESHYVQAQTLTLPADAKNALTVGAYKQSEDKIAWYSSRGPTEDGRVKPDLVGPTGVSTASMGFKTAEGSSFAAPHLAGLAALVLEYKPSYSPTAVKEYLISQTRDLGEAGPDSIFGSGAIALDEMPKGCGCASSPSKQSWPMLLFGIIALHRRRNKCDN